MYQTILAETRERERKGMTSLHSTKKRQRQWVYLQPQERLGEPRAIGLDVDRLGAVPLRSRVRWERVATHQSLTHDKVT
jgi:hypothetical protein